MRTRFTQFFLLLAFISSPLAAQQILLTDLSPSFGPIEANHLSMVSVVNTGAEEVTGAIVMLLTDAAGEIVAQKRSYTIQLKPGAQVSPGQIPWDRGLTYGNSAYASNFSRNGLLGFGNFGLCFQFHTPESESLGQVCTEKSSKPIAVFNLVFPLDGSSIQEQRPLLTWEPAAGFVDQPAGLTLSLIHI